jgi:hypothetical protein
MSKLYRPPGPFTGTALLFYFLLHVLLQSLLLTGQGVVRDGENITNDDSARRSTPCCYYIYQGMFGNYAHTTDGEELNLDVQ